MESLTLFKREETKEEREAREVLHVVAPEDEKRPDHGETTTVPATSVTNADRALLQMAPSSTVVASVPMGTATAVSFNNDNALEGSTTVTADAETTLQLGITSFGPTASTSQATHAVPVQSSGDMEDIGLQDESPLIVAHAASSSSYRAALLSSSDAGPRENVKPDLDDSDDDDDDEIPSIDMRSDTEEE